MTQRNSLSSVVRNHPWFSGVFLFLFVLIALVYWIFLAPNTVAAALERPVGVPRGVSFKSVTDSLESAGVLRTRWTFNVAGRLLGITTDMKVGKYLFPAGLSNIEILKDLVSGKSRFLMTVVISEGWRIERMAIRYSQILGIDSEKFINLCRSERFTRSLGIHEESLEGYLMPDTYKFYWQTEEENIIEHMVEEFRKFYSDSLKARQAELKMTMNKVLTLASIVENETRIGSERATIAGVYYNRLKKRMRLEADPTIQYIISDGPRRLYYGDLRLDSPYNTYRNYGLPPGPVGSPGRQAILAVLYPEKHSYLFFVADGKGGHTFSRNYNEHRKAVQKYRRLRTEAEKNSQTNG